MPRVTLSPQDDGGITIANPSGGMIYLPQHRLRVWVRVGGEYACRQAVLDTGTPACILSKKVWQELENAKRIEWICHPPSADGQHPLPTTTILGGRYPFRLGRIALQLLDFLGGELPEVTVRMLCLEDAPGQPPDQQTLSGWLLLGLEGVLNGRTLTVSASADGSAWAASLAE
jgi:hypothetical protein